MGEESEPASRMECCVCGAECNSDHGTVEVVESGGELGEDDWYFHLAGVGRVDGDTLFDPELYAFCPRCCPETAPRVDDDDFDIDEYVRRRSEEVADE